jgi:cholesterol oxidase
MPEHFDVVIVGSGFGGSVMAFRLAEKGRRVCVLERGKAYPPNSFPRTPDAMGKNFWGPRYGLHGMYDLWSFRHLGAIVSSGLGGGSLIYANVLIRKDEKWFVHENLAQGGYEDWPVTREDLDPHYERVEAMLCAQKYPFASEPYASTPKTRALRDAADVLIRSGRYEEGELEWLLPSLAVTFGNPGEAPVPGAPIREAEPNLHGLPRSTCRLCAECDIGCNYGSKNTLDFTYLSAAKRQRPGATILTGREVKRLAPRPSAGGGYAVTFLNHEAAPVDGRAPIEEMTCDRLVLAAGAIGTPYLLLKNAKSFPGISAKLGTRFGGNGDILGVARDCTWGAIEPSHGPVITSALRVADALDGHGVRGRGFYVEDAGLPAFFQWMMTEADASNIARGLSFAKGWLGDHFGRDPHTNLSEQFSKLMGDGRKPATMMPMLGMGRDVPSGRMSLNGDGDLDVDWDLDDSKAYFDRARGVMEDLAQAAGGRFMDDPVWYLNRSITVHPLGGCPMSRSIEEGVVDAATGEVFGFPGLHIADGSIMPGPVGPNPSLTIAALADRFADRL